jgi:hypothetical protein
MSRILLDEGVAIGVRGLLIMHDVRSAAEVGWVGLTNGDLIIAPDDAGYEVMIWLVPDVGTWFLDYARWLAALNLPWQAWALIR